MVIVHIMCGSKTCHVYCEEDHKHTRTSYTCCHCTQVFSRVKAFERHFPDCSKHLRQKIRFPDDENDIVRFKDFQNQEAHPFVIYCDFESYLVPTNIDPTPNSTFPINTHEVSGFCMYTVASDEQYATKPFVFSGEDAIEVFFDRLLVEQQRIALILDQNIDMCALTREQQAAYDACDNCYYCKKTFTADNYKCRHHKHHVTNSNFVAPVCRFCNLALKPSKRKSKEDETHWFIPILFHNFKNYDSHFIIRNFNRRLVRVGEDKYKDVRIIATSSEKYLSIEINYLRFIDSVQFLSASLDTLVKNLRNAGEANFVHTSRHMGGKKYIFEKGIFPYEFFTSLDKFKDTSLPPIESFHSALNDEEISADDYLKAQNVWKEFGCTTFKDYHDEYMKLDVLLLADVFENFRKMCLESYQLDPSYYLTLPSFGWSAMLKLTNVELRLITDVEQESFISGSIRGAWLR